MDRCDYDSKQNFMYVPFQPTIKRCYADGNQKTNQFLLHLYQSQILQGLVSGLSSGLRMMFKLNVSLFPVLASSAAPLMRFISIFPALCTPFQFSLIQQYTSPKKNSQEKTSNTTVYISNFQEKRSNHFFLRCRCGMPKHTSLALMNTFQKYVSKVS